VTVIVPSLFFSSSTSVGEFIVSTTVVVGFAFFFSCLLIFISAVDLFVFFVRFGAIKALQTITTA